MVQKVIYPVCSHIKDNSIKSKLPSREDIIDEEEDGEDGSPFIFCRYCRQNMIITDKEYDITKIQEDDDDYDEDDDDDDDDNNAKTGVSFLKRKRNDYIKLIDFHKK